MRLFRKVVSVKPNQIGYLYRQNKFQKRLNPGIYKFFDFSNKFDAVIISTISKLITISNQEVLTQDNISLRLSYILEHQITTKAYFCFCLKLPSSKVYINFDKCSM